MIFCQIVPSLIHANDISVRYMHHCMLELWVLTLSFFYLAILIEKILIAFDISRSYFLVNWKFDAPILWSCDQIHNAIFIAICKSCSFLFSLKLRQCKISQIVADRVQTVTFSDYLQWILCLFSSTSSSINICCPLRLYNVVPLVVWRH